MTKIIKENWFKLLLILFVILAFYWYEWRPSKAIRGCSLGAVDGVNKMKSENKTVDREDVEYFYRKCLRENGLEIGTKADWK